MAEDSSGNTRICVEKMLPSHAQHMVHMKQNSNSEYHFQKLRAAFFADKIWPKGAKITYAFIGTGKQIPRTSLNTLKNRRGYNGQPLDIDPLQNSVGKMSVIDAVDKIIKERISPIVGLNISRVTDPKDANVRISFDPNGGAWSLVGTDCLHEKLKPTMNLGWFDVATVMHEWGHTLGMIHEHQNPSGNPIKWDDPKVYKWAKDTQGWDKQTTDSNIISRYKSSQINGSVFDPQSIMLYFFPGSLTENNEGTHENLRLSGLDVTWINKMYPHSPEVPAVFYKDVYNENIENSISVSAQQQDTTGGYSASTKKIVIITASIIAVIGLIALIVWLIKRYKRKRRYGR
jgi:hypothetical protein